MVTLDRVAPFRDREVELFQRFHAFHRGGHAEAGAHRDYCANDRRTFSILWHLPDKRLVDLDLVEWKTPQIAERRIARAEIVH